MTPFVWVEKQRVVIRVTAMHIAAGRQGDCFACPLALALTETLGGSWGVSDMLLQESVTGYSLPLPPVAARFITQFDRKQSVVPFDLELEIPLALVPKHLLPGPFNAANKCGFIQRI